MFSFTKTSLSAGTEVSFWGVTGYKGGHHAGDEVGGAEEEEGAHSVEAGLHIGGVVFHLEEHRAVEEGDEQHLD